MHTNWATKGYFGNLRKSLLSEFLNNNQDANSFAAL